MGAIEELSTELVSGLLSNGRNLPDASRCPNRVLEALLVFRGPPGFSSAGEKVMGINGK